MNHCTLSQPWHVGHSTSSDSLSARTTGFGRRLAILIAWSLALTLFAVGFTEPDGVDGSLPPSVAAVSDIARTDEQIVERWRGTVYQESVSFNTFAPCFGAWVCPGDFQRLTRQQWDLEVFADGYTRGYIRSTLLTYSYRQSQTNINCGPVAETNYTLNDCQYAPQITQPNGLIFVEGKRENEQFTGLPVLRLEEWDRIEECKVTWTARGVHSRTGAVVHQEQEQVCNSFGTPLRLPIQTYEDGRAPRIIMRGGYLIGLVDEPFLELDRELLDRSIFLDQVPVEELFTANVNWHSPGGGWLTWQWADEAPDRIGPTQNSAIPRPINPSAQGTGTKDLQAQAKGALGQTSRPELVRIPVAPPPVWSGPPAEISATKVEGAVVYKDSTIFPEPAFEGVVTVPNAVPWFGGKRMGISETQGVLEWEVFSTTEGQAKLSGQSGFEAMGGTVIGALGGRAKVVLTQSGVEIPEGGLDFRIAGKLESDPEPLLSVVPALNPAMNVLQRISPQIARFVTERANAKLEIQPQLAFGFNYHTENDEIKFQSAEAQPTIGFKTIVEINLIKDVLDASAAIGGEIAAAFQVPAPYFKEAALKGLVQAKLRLYRHGWEGEHAWSLTLSGASAAGEDLHDYHQGSTGWQLMDTSYLHAPNYARWAGDDVFAQAIDQEAGDRRMVENVSPLANPSVHVWVNPGENPRIAQAWVHDTLAGDEITAARGEIAYSRNQGSLQFLTEDDVDDLAPKIVYLPNDGTMVLWQRQNTATPPDLNDDPAAYLSTWQIAAQRTGTNQHQILSDGHTLNYRYHLAATHDGALAVWVNNPANQIIGDTDNPDHILFAHYQLPGGNWSAAAPVVSDLAGLLSLDLATAAHTGHVPADDLSGPLAALVYSQDMDAGPELFYAIWDGDAWSAPVRLTHNDAADEFPQLALDASGAPFLVWRQDGALKFLHGSWDAAPVDLDLPGAAERPDYTLIQGHDGKLALIWQAPGPDDTRIAYAIYDPAHNLWSRQHTLDAPNWGDPDEWWEEPDELPASAPDSFMATGIAAALIPPRPNWEEEHRLLLTYQLAHVDLMTMTVEGVAIPNAPQIGQHDLRVATVPLVANLSVTPADLSAPAQDQIQAVIHNTGHLAVRDAPVVLYLGPPDPVSGLHTDAMTQTLPLLASGDAVTLTYSLPPTALSVQRKSLRFADAAFYAVHIDPQRTLNESNVNDNHAVLGANLQMTMLPPLYTPEGIMVRGQVGQTGPLYTSLTVDSLLTRDGPDGTVLGGAQIGFPLTPTAEVRVSALITPGVLGPGRHAVFWMLDPDTVLGAGEAGDSARRDQAGVVTVMVLPDLSGSPDLVHFERTTSDVAHFRMEVQNLGNWPSQGGHVEVFDGMPGHAGVQSLLRLPLPAIAPGELVEVSGALQLAARANVQTELTAIYVLLDADGALDEIDKNNNLIAVGDALESADTTPAGGYRLNIPAVQR